MSIISRLNKIEQFEAQREDPVEEWRAEMARHDKMESLYLPIYTGTIEAYIKICRISRTG
ncbi:hypothetical protein [Peribacillus sp. NPDC060253]|uniref:hypothetical protein n=1 Tax=Peribacillus sp. NPDC060253 TaxID=3347084 RepID=UPI00364B5713